MVFITVGEDKPGYNWKLTLKKGAIIVGQSIGLAAATALIGYLEVTTFPPEHAIYVGIIISILRMYTNYKNHKDDK